MGADVQQPEARSACLKLDLGLKLLESTIETHDFALNPEVLQAYGFGGLQYTMPTRELPRESELRSQLGSPKTENFGIISILDLRKRCRLACRFTARRYNVSHGHIVGDEWNVFAKHPRVTVNDSASDDAGVFADYTADWDDTTGFRRGREEIAAQERLWAHEGVLLGEEILDIEADPEEGSFRRQLRQLLLNILSTQRLEVQVVARQPAAGDFVGVRHDT